mmetsp:Transcript_35632/g.101532  ORF Transcript_35632/g.101532 Transcript_35632/m.101532 type:complete len:564 (-) Transcript_35632:105-1796(-)
MKVQVNIKTLASKEANTTLDMVAAENDTVGSLKDRVAIIQLNPFPEQDVLFEGRVLQDCERLVDCGLKEGSTWSMDLVIKASEATLAQQLKDLLQARDLSCDELGLLYCYKFGASVTQALQTLGLAGEKLQDFLRRQKGFQVENSQVALMREDTGLKPFSLAAEVESILKATSNGSMEIKDLCGKFAAKFNISLASIAGVKPVEFLVKEKERFVVKNRCVVQLRGVASPTPATAAPKTERPGTPPSGDLALPPGLTPPPPAKVVQAPVDGPKQNLASTDSAQYVALHNKIANKASSTKAQQVVSTLIDALKGAMFLNVDRVVKGGSIGKGTVIDGMADAELVFFLKGMPTQQQERWLPPLLRSVASTLAEGLGEDVAVDDVVVTEDSVRLFVEGLQPVDLRFSPDYGSYENTIKALKTQGPDARRWFAASFSEERTEFVSRQPAQIKMTIRLLKWWRDQQVWSSALTRPSDEILELVAIFSANQSTSEDVKTAIIKVMSRLARFDELRMMWSNFYSKNDVPVALFRHRPLLMDPVNPFVNVADPQVFEPSELMEAARTTNFFY